MKGRAAQIRRSGRMSSSGASGGRNWISELMAGTTDRLWCGAAEDDALDEVAHAVVDRMALSELVIASMEGRDPATRAVWPHATRSVCLDLLEDRLGELSSATSPTVLDVAPHGAERNAAAVVVASIHVEEQGWGFLLARPQDDRTWSDERSADLADIARQLGLALLAGRAHQDRTRMALFEDRDRIARDMHDHVIQQLFATGLSLQSASRLAQQDVVGERIDDAVDSLDEAIWHIRRTIFELHRPIPRGGLRDQINALIESSTISLGFTPSLTITGSLAGLDKALEADIVAVVQEGLSNIVRHARATAASVQIVSDDTVLVRILDDGVGADPGVARSGLVNLGARAAGRSGRFEVRRRSPRGTALRWQVARVATDHYRD